MTFRAPRFLRPLLLPIDVSDDANMLDNMIWNPYGSKTEANYSGPSLINFCIREKMKLTSIIHDVSTMLYYNPNDRLSARAVLDQYRRFKRWREELPFEVSTAGVYPPHFVSLLILYSCAVIQLLRPLLDFNGFPNATVETVIWNLAKEGTFLLEHYRSRYTFRHQSVLQMFSALHFCDVVIRFFPSPDRFDANSKGGQEIAQLTMEMLTEAQEFYPIAGPFQYLLWQTITQLSPPIAQSFDKLPAHPSPAEYRIDEIIKAFTRPTYLQPVAEIHRKYDFRFNSDWIAEAGGDFRERSEGRSRLKASDLMQIKNMLND